MCNKPAPKFSGSTPNTSELPYVTTLAYLNEIMNYNNFEILLIGSFDGALIGFLRLLGNPIPVVLLGAVDRR